MVNQQAAELTEAGIGSLDDPPAFVGALFAAILVAPLFVVAPIGRDQLDDAILQTFLQRVRIIGSVGNHPLRLSLGTIFEARDAEFGECGFRKTIFSRKGSSNSHCSSVNSFCRFCMAKVQQTTRLTR